MELAEEKKQREIEEAEKAARIAALEEKNRVRRNERYLCIGGFDGEAARADGGVAVCVGGAGGGAGAVGSGTGGHSGRDGKHAGEVSSRQENI